MADEVDDIEQELNSFTPTEADMQPEDQPESPAEQPEDDEPVEAAESDEGEEVEEAEDSEESAEEADERPRKRKRNAESRIKELTRDKRHFQREVEAMRRELEALKGTKQEPLTTPEGKEDKGDQLKAPSPADYQYGDLDPDYNRAVARHEAQSLIQQELAAIRNEREKQRQTDAAERQAAQLREKANSIEAAGKKAYSDFSEVVVEGAENGDYALTREMFEAVVEAEKPADVLYHLASNPDEALRISQLSPVQQAIQIGRLDARSGRKRVTRTPAPIGQTRGTGSAVATKANTTDFAAFERMANKGA